MGINIRRKWIPVVFLALLLTQIVASFNLVKEVNASYPSYAVITDSADEFKEYPPGIVLNSGDWGLPDVWTTDIYGGTGAGGRCFAVKFVSPTSLSGFQVRWYGKKIGSPPELVLELYEDIDGKPYSLGTPMESASQPATVIGETTGFHPAVSFTSSLMAEKFYWIMFHTEGGDASNKYVIYSKTLVWNESRTFRTENGYEGIWGDRGSCVFWLQDLRGADVQIYPYERYFNWVRPAPQEFVAPNDMAFNMIFFFLSDRAYDESVQPVRVVRVSDGAVLATGYVDQNETHGTEWGLSPVTLDNVVTCLAGEKYRLEIGSTIPPGGEEWQFFSIYETDPPKAGFQGQSRYVLFKLGLMNLPINNLDLMDVTGLGMDSISETVWGAIRFKPSLSGTLKSFDIRIRSKSGTPNFIVALRNDDGTGFNPAGTDLEALVVPGADMPSSGWVTIAGFTTPLVPDTYYWIVFRCLGAGICTLHRFTSPYKFMFRVSHDSGLTWGRGAEGPTELTFRITTSSEIIEQALEDVPQTSFSTKTLISQSFSPLRELWVGGVFVVISKTNPYDDHDIEVTIRPDSGLDVPSSTILGRGALSYTRFAGLGVYYIGLDSPCRLSAGERYWIVLRTLTGNCYCKTVAYRDPAQSFGGTTYKAKVSTDEGATWTPIGESDMIFAVAEYVSSKPSTPTTDANIPTYFMSSWQGLDYVESMGLSYNESIETHLLPTAIRRFHVDMPDRYSSQIEDWLNACDSYGLENWFLFMPWGYVWYYPDELKGTNHPEAMSYNKSGNAQPDYVVVIDWFDILYPYYRDWLKQVLDWYGAHQSVIGIGSQPLVDYPIYGGRGGALNYGYNPTSIERFTRTIYYTRDVNATGFHKDGSKCKLWEHYTEKSVSYSLVDLIADIDIYHNTPVRDYPLHGYIAYLNVENAKLVKALYDFAVTYLGRELMLKHPFHLWVASDVGLPVTRQTLTGAATYTKGDISVGLYRMLSENALWWVNLCARNDNPFRLPTDDEKLNTYLIGLPTLPHNPFICEADWRFDYITDLRFTSTYRRFGEILNRMRAYGGWFGEARGIKALMIGELEVGLGPQYLSPVFDLAMTHGEFEEANLTRFGDFKSFNILLMWGGGRPNVEALTVGAQERIKTFIYNGGGVVSVAFPSWLAEVLGTGTPVGYDHPVMQPFTSGAPTVTEYSYGAGRVLTLPAPTRVEWIERGSDWWVILTNALLYVSKREDLIPAWYYGNGAYITTRPWSPDICYSICGAPGKVLVWLSNRGNITRNMEMHLNSDFYGIDPNGWIAIDVSNWTVAAKGTGTDIEIDATISPESWMPLYIMNTTSNLQDLYSNIFIKDKSVISNKATYTLQGPYNQTSWLIVNSTTIPSSVTANNTGILPQHTSLSTLNQTTTPNGWYHDPTNKILYIKFKPTSTVKIEITQPTGPTPTHTLRIDSSPITGVPFTLDGVSQATPFSTTLDEGTHTVTMPKSTDIGGTSYDFKNWEDGSTNPTRSIDLTTDMTITAYYEAISPSYTLASLPLPFVSESGSISDTFIIIPISDPHGPSGPAHTMDTMGGVLIACRLGLEATSGMVKTAMDSYSYISTYDPVTAKVTMTDTTSHLIVLGSPGVNQVAYYYNELKDANGTNVLPVLFLRDAVGDYLYVQSSGNEYRIGPDDQGRMAEYGVVQLYREGDRYVMLVYGLGGESTKAAAKTVAEFDQWGLTGTAVIVKYYDSDGDGYLDTTEIVETVDLGPSTILSSLYSIQSIHSVPLLMLILLPILYYKRKTDSNGPESQGKHRHMRLQPGGHQQANQEST